MFSKTKIIILITALLTILCSMQCGNSTGSLEILNKQLIGQWQWVSSIGGFAGETRTPETEVHNIVLNFISDSNFISTKIDSTGIVIITEVATGAYYTAFEPVWSVSDSVDVIYMDNFLRSAFEIIADTLFLNEICADCFGHKYIRIP